jgi:Glyoxalase/Bleomycin resistance protein/Dioxygenase superfamily
VDPKIPIRSLDCTVIFARNLLAMLGFSLHRELGSKWLEFRAVTSAGASTLEERGVKITSGPTDHHWGYRTLFFRDLDGNVLEICAEIQSAQTATRSFHRGNS